MDRQWWRYLALGLLAASVFWELATIRLGAQGVYADEVHQAAAAFVWTGSPPEHMCAVTAWGVPLLNMPYSGAIKSAVYGIGMRVTGKGFTLTGWRRLGIAFTALGLLLFALTAGPAMGRLPTAVFLLLMTTDATVLLASRHDWGPVALALFVRLAALGLLVRSTLDEAPRPRSTFWLAAMAGLAVFEKLSSVAFAAALGAALAADPRRRSWRHLAAGALGGGVGAAPLLLVNFLSWTRDGVLVSLSAPMGRPPVAVGAVARRAVAYLAVGSGTQVERFILDAAPPLALALAEALMVVLALATAVAAARRRGGSVAMVAAGAAVGYLVVFAVLEALPRVTWVHHWIIGTPFQYLAVAAGVMAWSREGGGRWSRWPAALLVLWLALRVASVGHLGVALAEGRSSRRWDPRLTRLAEAAAGLPAGDVIVAADWGMALPIYCFSQGRPGFVREPLWRNEWRSQVADLERPGRYRRVHLLLMDPPSGLRPGRTEAVVRWMESRKRWREVPPPPWLAASGVVTARTFVAAGSVR